MRSFNACLGLLGLGMAFIAAPATAATVTGQVTSSLVLTSGCLVNGAGGSTNLNFGALNLGTQTSLFTQAGAQVLSAGGGAISILCSNGVVPVIKIGAGVSDGQSAGGTRALSNGAGSYIPYDFYIDSGFSTVLPIQGTVTLPTSTGAAQTINIYGRAVGKAGLPAGTYTDTVAIELSF